MKTGDLVYSLAGRDKGQVLIVVGIVDENYVRISDGRIRKADTPKLKKLKHLKPIIDCDEVILEMPVEKITNRCIREKINAYKRYVDEQS